MAGDNGIDLSVTRGSEIVVHGAKAYAEEKLLELPDLM